MRTVSVVMTVYNGAAFLAEAIESVLRQSHAAFEFVIVDDGSTDESREIVRHYASLDHRIKPVLLPRNHGLYAALNIGVEAASGELIARFDCDDVMVPTRLERQMEYLDQHPELSVAASYSHLIDERGQVIAKTMPVVDIDRAKRTGDPSLFLEIVHPTVMMRKADFIAVGGYRAFSPVEDRDLWSRLATRGYQIGMQPEFLLLNRRHGGNISLRQLRRGSRLGSLIDDNTKRRWRGEDERSLEEYLASMGPLARINEARVYLAQYCYRKAVLAYSARTWGSVALLLPLACALRPAFVAQTARKAVLFPSRTSTARRS